MTKTVAKMMNYLLQTDPWGLPTFTSQDPFIFLIVKYPPTDPLTPAGPVLAVLAESGNVLTEYGSVLQNIPKFWQNIVQFSRVLESFCKLWHISFSLNGTFWGEYLTVWAHTEEYGTEVGRVWHSCFYNTAQFIPNKAQFGQYYPLHRTKMQ